VVIYGTIMLYKIGLDFPHAFLKSSPDTTK
jgi:hypothetical protein